MEEKLGWLSPMGDFYETDWGKHREEAEKILQRSDKQKEFLYAYFYDRGERREAEKYLE